MTHSKPTRLMTPESFREKYFSPESRPDLRTDRRWITEGDIPGVRLGPKRYYVDVAAWEALAAGALDAVLTINGA